jgi:ABC-2 type transport system ATP-binding protein
LADHGSGGRVFHIRVSTDQADAIERLRALADVTEASAEDGRIRAVLGNSRSDPGILAEALVLSGHRLIELREEQVGLEEVFMRVTRGDTQ